MQQNPLLNVSIRSGEDKHRGWVIFCCCLKLLPLPAGARPPLSDEHHVNEASEHLHELGGECSICLWLVCCTGVQLQHFAGQKPELGSSQSIGQLMENCCGQMARLHLKVTHSHTRHFTTFTSWASLMKGSVGVLFGFITHK